MSDVGLGIVRTQIPSRLDRLPWSRFHWRIVIGLGTAWVLDGLEVTIVGSVASRLTEHGSGIAITSSGIGIAAALYVTGACLGALVFGHLTDRFGRKKLFLITLGVYMAATAVTAVSFSAWFFFIFRFLTGAGIGGEYAAINSAIDELIPARARGGIDLVINGSYWIGSIVGSLLSLLFLDESLFPADIGWRLTFVLGIILASAVMLVRRHVPESPRWLFIHGYEEEAEALVDEIEADVRARTGADLEPVTRTLTIHQRRTIGFGSIVKTAFGDYPRRSILCLSLFVGQAFIYNGITFDLGTLMTKFFHVSSGITPVFLILYAGANFLGPLLLGRLFDTVGRVPMISGTYLGSAVMGLVLAGLFVETGLLNRWGFIVVVMVTFFLASAGASAAYLTSSEIFPMETRALAIAFFYAIGTAVGGIAGPLLFGPLIATGSRGLVGVAFLIGSVLMAAGAVAELKFGVRAEGAQLEDIATPMTAAEAEAEGDAPAGAGPGRGGTPAREAPTAARLAGDHAQRRRASELRARAAEHRARAAEHRARLHERLASEDATTAERRVQVEETLAAVSDARALADDERAAAADARAALAARAERPEPGGAGGEGGSTADAERVRAADQRARGHEEDALALLAADDEEAEHHRHLAAAAVERARGAEQRAAAAEQRAQEHEPRAAMHEAWAQMHEARARGRELRVLGRQAAADAADQAADRAGALARARAFHLEAQEHRETAAVEHEHEEAEQAEVARAQARWRAELRAQELADDQRIRERVRRQREREATGLRRYRPGPGRLGTPPGVSLVPPLPEEVLDHEITTIERALAAHGPTDRRELARLVGSEYWGPGVFAEALRQAVADGGVRRLSRRVYAPAVGADDAAGEEEREGGTGQPA